MQSRIALIAVVGSAFSPLVHAASSTDGFLRDFFAAYESRDVARFSEFYANDATFVDPSFELNFSGREQIREMFAKIFPKYQSLDFQIAHTTTAGEDVVVEGTLVGETGGKTVRVPFVSVFHLQGKLIAAQRDMFDVAHFLAQVGRMPPPFGPLPSSSPTP